jgi:starch synthase
VSPPRTRARRTPAARTARRAGAGRRPLRIGFVASEVAPFAKTGGLGDVCGALTRYLSEAGHDVRTFLPLYGNLKKSGQAFVPVGFLRDVPLRMGRHALSFGVSAATLPGTRVPVHFVECPPLYGRAETYSSGEYEHLRFAFLARAAIESWQRMGFSPDVVHVHDWHTALLPLYLKTLYAWDRARFGATRTLLTIHNVGYQGKFPASVVEDIGLEPHASLLHQDDLRAGVVGFLKTGIMYADKISTVSETHAKEMMTPEYGMGLDPYLRAREENFVGIVNGIDAAVWDPATDAHLPARYTAGDLSGKRECRADLLRSLGLDPDPRGPVMAVVCRLTAQKGLDLLFDTVPPLLRRHDARLVVLGNGSGRIPDRFEAIVKANPGRAWFRAGYDEPSAHRIEAGADVFLMPSRYEPCGLNQMYSLRYGTVPVVRRTGGLADTVADLDPRTGRGTGFVFDEFSPAAISEALARMLAAWRSPATWGRLVRAGMAQDFSWERRVREYEALYARL